MAIARMDDTDGPLEFGLTVQFGLLGFWAVEFGLTAQFGREAPSAATARRKPGVEITIRCRAVTPRSSRMLCQVGPTTARHRRCPFSPAGQGVEMCKSVP